MTANTHAIFEGTIKSSTLNLVNANGTNKVSLVSAGSNGTRIDEVYCCLDDTVDINLHFWINDGSTDYHLQCVIVSAGSGYGAVDKINAIGNLAPNLGYLVIASGYSLKVSCDSAVTSGKTLGIITQGGDF